MINEMINKLNPMQKQAVLTTEGPLLLLAGAALGLAGIVGGGFRRQGAVLILVHPAGGSGEDAVAENRSRQLDRLKNVGVFQHNSRPFRAAGPPFGLYANQYTIPGFTFQRACVRIRGNRADCQ